jgi:hypothetical protein
MTEQEFLDKLKAVAVRSKFTITASGLIRLTENCRHQCPIIAVIKEYNPSASCSNQYAVENGMQFLGMESDLAENVMHSADNPHGPLRAQLLEACGLKEYA